MVHDWWKKEAFFCYKWPVHSSQHTFRRPTIELLQSANLHILTVAFPWIHLKSSVTSLIKILWSQLIPVHSECIWLLGLLGNPPLFPDWVAGPPWHKASTKGRSKYWTYHTVHQDLQCTKIRNLSENQREKSAQLSILSLWYSVTPSQCKSWWSLHSSNIRKRCILHLNWELKKSFNSRIFGHKNAELWVRPVLTWSHHQSRNRPSHHLLLLTCTNQQFVMVHDWWKKEAFFFLLQMACSQDAHFKCYSK